MQNPFHLIGRTPYFCKKSKFSFFESPLQKSNGGVKNGNFILKFNHIVRPIKWKGILHRLTIWSQKIGQYNSVESSLKMGLIFFHFEDYSKSARWMISFWLVTCYHTPTLYKTAEKVTVIRFFTQTSVGSTVKGMRILLPDEFGGQFWHFLQFLIYLRFGWTNLDEIGDQIEEFLML